MAWKLRKDKLQANTPQDEVNETADITAQTESVAAPPPEALSSPPFQPSAEEAAPPHPFSEAVNSSVESSPGSGAKELPGGGLRWRSRRSQREEPASPEEPLAPFVAESAPPAPEIGEDPPFLPPQIEPFEPVPVRPKFSPLDFREPDAVPLEPAPTEEHPIALEPESGSPVEEPYFPPFDFTPPAPPVEADLVAEDHAEAKEEPLFSPMPVAHSLPPLEMEMGTEAPEEPFFPLPPPSDTPFSLSTTKEPIEDAGAGGIEEPQFLSVEPMALPTAETEEPLFSPLPDWNTNPFLLPEAAASEPLPQPETSPFHLPEVEATDHEPLPAEPVEAAVSDDGDELAALGPFAPYQPQEHPLPEPLSTEADLPHLEAVTSETAKTSEEPEHEAPPVFEASPLFMAPPETFNDAEREAIAPSLVMPETGTGVPRVAPFIVDIPPPAEEAPSIRGMLLLRIGKLTANYPITKEATVIGRPDSTVQSYPDIEIELDDAVSRRHAEVRHQDDAYSVVDLMSTNGTRLNGEKLDPYKEYTLAPGDRIRIGDRTELIFE